MDKGKEIADTPDTSMESSIEETQRVLTPVQEENQIDLFNQTTAKWDNDILDKIAAPTYRDIPRKEEQSKKKIPVSIATMKELDARGINADIRRLLEKHLEIQLRRQFGMKSTESMENLVSRMVAEVTGPFVNRLTHLESKFFDLQDQIDKLKPTGQAIQTALQRISTLEAQNLELQKLIKFRDSAHLAQIESASDALEYLMITDSVTADQLPPFKEEAKKDPAGIVRFEAIVPTATTSKKGSKKIKKL